MSKPFEITLTPEQSAVVGALSQRLTDRLLSEPARFLGYPLPRPEWVDGGYDLDTDDAADWLVSHPENADWLATSWNASKGLFQPEADCAGFCELLKDALTEEDAHARDFLEAQPWMTKLNESVWAYQRHLSENGAAPYAAALGASGEADHDHVMANWPEAEFVLGRSLGLDADQVIDVVGHWLENGAVTKR